MIASLTKDNYEAKWMHSTIISPKEIKYAWCRNDEDEIMAALMAGWGDDGIYIDAKDEKHLKEPQRKSQTTNKQPPKHIQMLFIKSWLSIIHAYNKQIMK